MLVRVVVIVLVSRQHRFGQRDVEFVMLLGFVLAQNGAIGCPQVTHASNVPRAERSEPASSEPAYSEVMRSALALFGRTIRAVRIAATDQRIPKPLRWLAALGLLPIPGPFDEALLLLVAVPLALFYRRPLAEAWTRAAAR